MAPGPIGSGVEIEGSAGLGSGGFASGAFASGALASGALASTGFASGALVSGAGGFASGAFASGAFTSTADGAGVGAGAGGAATGAAALGGRSALGARSCRSGRSTRSVDSAWGFSEGTWGAAGGFSFFSVSADPECVAPSRGAGFSVGFSWGTVFTVELFSLLLAKFPSLPGRSRPRTAAAQRLPGGWRGVRALAQIDSTCPFLWRLPDILCRDTPATASGRDPYPSIRGGNRVSDTIA